MSASTKMTVILALSLLVGVSSLRAMDIVKDGAAKATIWISGSDD
jgi:hypothetical protein